MPRDAVFTKILQIGLVVRDLDAAMRKQWEIFGIGPWSVYTMNEENMRDTKIRGKPCTFSMKVALAMLDDMQIELIQPLDEDGIYTEFLREHGEGMHHAACAVADFQRTIARLAQEGVQVLMEGVTEDGLGFAYLDTRNSLACITEIYDVPPELPKREPEYRYPAET